MTRPKTAMEAWQAAKDAEERVFAEEMARTDNGVLASAFGEKAAASVLDAWASERERALREALQKHAARFDFCASMIEAGFSASGTQRMEHFMKAKAFANEARHLLAGERGE